ncbi:MAG: sugar ABC transporter substrate-binding protein [Limnochordales bacterium]|nr:sugar ABC transporter substrate-binding protein [Limnochordales bacterium]
MKAKRWKETSLRQRLLISCTFALIVFLAAGSLARAATGPVEIRFAVWGSASKYGEIIQAFEKENPDIKVKLELRSWGEHWTHLLTSIAAGASPDVIRVNGGYLLDLVADGALLPLDEMIRRDKLDMSQYFNTGDIFLFGGQTYGLPEVGDIMGVYYNIDRLEEAGVPPPGRDWTWSDMAAIARKLTVRSGDRVQRWGVMIDLGNTGQKSWVNFFLQNGTRALRDDKRRALLDTPAAIEAVQFLADRYQKDRSVAELPFTFQKFIDEKASMMYALVPTTIPTLMNAKFRWDIAPMPRGKRFASETNFVGFSISSQTKQKEAAWRFLKFLAGPTAQGIIARIRDGLPALKSAAYSREFLMPEQGPRRLAEVLQVTAPHTYDLQFTPGWSLWTAAVDSHFVQAVQGGKDVEVAMKAANEQVNAILDQSWRELDAKLARLKR